MILYKRSLIRTTRGVKWPPFFFRVYRVTVRCLRSTSSHFRRLISDMRARVSGIFIFREAEESGLPAPEIVEIGMRLRFVVYLAEPVPATNGHGRTLFEKPKRPAQGAQSGAQSSSILSTLMETPLSAAELTQALGLETKTGAFKRTIKELLAQALIEYILPEKLSSRLQKYGLTDKGREYLEKMKLDKL